MREIREYTSEKYGNFSIEQYEDRGKNRVCIWWDFYDEQDGLPMEPDGDFLEWFKSCDVKDFSDLPEQGFFKSFDEAYNYIVKKFGNIE
jgi:hypothetical protein